MSVRYFYPRSPCGERRTRQARRATQEAFLSTLSLRRATLEYAHAIDADGISIHALLAESDLKSLMFLLSSTNFYPRSPCGERLAFRVFKSNCFSISIHALLAESDEILQVCPMMSVISIHALLAESDQPHFPCTELYQHFYPRSPCGERHQKCRVISIVSSISIHALLAESDRRSDAELNAQNNFYPRSPCGERRRFQGLQEQLF